MVPYIALEILLKPPEMVEFTLWEISLFWPPPIGAPTAPGVVAFEGPPPITLGDPAATGSNLKARVLFTFKSSG